MFQIGFIVGHCAGHTTTYGKLLKGELGQLIPLRKWIKVMALPS
jgi:hypothetical protein